MKTYYILWTYSANYSCLKEVKAASPREALDATTGYFSSDFQSKGTVYVFDRAPVLIQGENNAKSHSFH